MAMLMDFTLCFTFVFFFYFYVAGEIMESHDDDIRQLACFGSS